MNTALNIEDSTTLPVVNKFSGGKAFSYLPTQPKQKSSRKFQPLADVNKRERTSPNFYNAAPAQHAGSALSTNTETDSFEVDLEQENIENQSVITNEDLQIAMDNGTFILENYKQSGFCISIHKNITESKTEITEMISWNKKSELVEHAKKILNELISLEKNTELYRAIFSAKITLAHGKSGNTSTTILDEIMNLSQNAGPASNSKLRSEAQKLSHKLEALLYSYENYFAR